MVYLIHQLMYGLEMAIVDMGIDLGRRDTGMSQKDLYSSQISSFFEQCRSKAVSERMGCDSLGDTCEFGVCLDDVVYSISGELATKATTIIRMIDKY